MSEFKEGKSDILVATTVIEVGIDVPNATVMLIEHSERFGLAQLHQLRGRVGRGKHNSYCLLVAYQPLTDDGKLRVKAMMDSCDGFKIAEQDLQIRGPGDFMGTRQSGMPTLRFAQYHPRHLNHRNHAQGSLRSDRPRSQTRRPRTPKPEIGIPGIPR